MTTSVVPTYATDTTLPRTIAFSLAVFPSTAAQRAPIAPITPPPPAPLTQAPLQQPPTPVVQPAPPHAGRRGWRCPHCHKVWSIWPGLRMHLRMIHPRAWAASQPSDYQAMA